MNIKKFRIKKTQLRNLMPLFITVFIAGIWVSGISVVHGENISVSTEPKVGATSGAVPTYAPTKDDSIKTSAAIAESKKVSSTQQSSKTATTQATATAAAAAAAPTYVPIAKPSPRGAALSVSQTAAAAGRPAAIASQPVASWFGNWNLDVQSEVNAAVSAAPAGTLTTLVAYNIPVRDCGSYSAGGAKMSAEYKSWIRQFAAGIGARKAIVIVEPDALAQIDCLKPEDQAARYANLVDAINVLSTQTKAYVYLDGGHSNWVAPSTMADRLKKAGIGQARGFALNVSNYETTASNIAYGNKLSAATGKAFVVDTGRNGNGSNGEWCNPRGRALGERPTTSLSGNIDAYLWIKVPGESDGTCNGGPAAGAWWEDYAQELIRNSK